MPTSLAVRGHQPERLVDPERRADRRLPAARRARLRRLAAAVSPGRALVAALTRVGALLLVEALRRKILADFQVWTRIISFYVAGRRGLVVRVLSSGDRVLGFKSPPQQSVFFYWLFLLLPSFFLSLPTVRTLLHAMPVGTCLSVFIPFHKGGKKRGITDILAELSVR